MRTLLTCAATLALAPFSFIAAPAAACDDCPAHGTSVRVGSGGGEGGGEAVGGGGRLNTMFETADADESGGLSLEEFVASRVVLRHAVTDGTSCEHAGGEECDCAGRGGEDRPADADGNGSVSDEERDAHIAIRFAEIDGDEDGTVTVDELRTARRARRGFDGNVDSDSTVEIDADPDSE